ncbi:hypothetical protein B0A78_06815 [Flavobacterium columnare NBRC 100251 = ATCC 23463]|nr:hypothetical protein BU993_09945 [Flavobacterium columnare]PDS24424.1 hypothetical protein B0A78_06815 [Flavobacterium columnare NBRC 100251 = ATCC 23463]MBF6653427.1 hypothetical protein [Flavobacterium columnare]MBF6654516.1 hypothetical protein [Flavobacterium columnare]MBF6658049.1 hypothetical protein [Flavobacterium columnare]
MLKFKQFLTLLKIKKKIFYTPSKKPDTFGAFLWEEKLNMIIHLNLESVRLILENHYSSEYVSLN